MLWKGRLPRRMAYALLTLLVALSTYYSILCPYPLVVNALNTNLVARLGIGVVYGVVLSYAVSKLNWNLVAEGGVLMALVAAGDILPDSAFAARAAGVGVFLMAFDWVFESWGARAGYWYSHSSRRFVGAVPLEVMVGALSGGFAWALLMPPHFQPLYVLLVSATVGVAGAMGEDRLARTKAMDYRKGWTWAHAVVAYFLVWLLLSLVLYFLL